MWVKHVCHNIHWKLIIDQLSTSWVKPVIDSETQTPITICDSSTVFDIYSEYRNYIVVCEMEEDFVK